MTHDTWWGFKILSKFQLVINIGYCTTAPATLSLLYTTCFAGKQEETTEEDTQVEQDQDDKHSELM